MILRLISAIRERGATSDDGGLDLLHDLVDRTYAEYPNHPSEIVDTLLHFLKAPTCKVSEVPLDQFEQAIACFEGIGHICHWIQSNPEPTASTVTTSLRIFKASSDLVTWAHYILGVTKWFAEDHEDTLRYYAATTVLFDSLFNWRTRILSHLSTQPAMLDLVISWWTFSTGSHPPLHGDGSRDDSVAGEEDIALNLVYLITKQNPVGMAKAILDERVCSAQEFLVKTVLKMRTLLYLNQIPHLDHLPEHTIEIGNLRFIVIITDFLMAANASLHTAFMERGITKVYIMILIAAATKLEDLVEMADYHDESLASLLGLVGYVVNWAINSDTSILGHVNHVVRHGALEILGYAAPYIRRNSRIGDGFDIIFASLVPYAVHPRVLPYFLDATSRHILPRLGHPASNDFPQKKLANTTYLALVGTPAKLLPRDAEERLCDNLKHKPHKSGSSSFASRPERVCNRCHSVAYCSRQCQAEDWKALHRFECDVMSLKYMEQKAQCRWYSYRARSFHSRMMRHSMDTIRKLNSVHNHRGGLDHAEAHGVVWAVDILWEDHPAFGVELEEYVARATRMMPAELQPRFAALVGLYKRSIAADSDTPTVFLVEKKFRFGDVDVTLVVLLEEAESSAPAETHGEYRAVVEDYRIRDMESSAPSKIISSIWYTSERTDIMLGRRIWPNFSATQAISYEKVVQGLKARK
ncbi:hypothetical protein DFP72DRAFT_1169505 [Ephemerocybe angulata]|uniref:MYND-type domain-containing protein n=1 Tax=Ephemerocybe angulata TaxID=980116 RepID=A0A8H6HYY1_9AGAR|nr:hypothetical protein DFP72DRAFT_1169505 [Tulosesus angulatus]